MIFKHHLFDAKKIVMDIRHAEETGSLESDIHKCGLHPGQDPGDPPTIDITYQVLPRPSLDIEFHHGPVFHESHSCFVRSGINYEFISHNN